MSSGSNELKSQWWYCTDASTVEGPVTTQVFVSLFAKGYVDGLTIITSDPLVPKSDWLSLSEHPELSEAARTADTELNDTDLHESSEQDQKEGPETYPSPKDNKPLQSRSSDLPNAKTAEERERKRLSRKRARKAAKLRKRQNTSIYITGLPLDCKEAEVATYFAKCGIILPNPETGRPRVKLYRNDDDTLKGDALITYALRPSVENAISILDGAPLREGTSQLTVKEATFEHKQNKEEAEAGDVIAKRPHLAVRGRDLVEEALTWSENPDSQKGAPRIVILKNVFEPHSADYEIIREDMQEGCQTCGEIEKITVFERNEEGAVAIKFTSVEASLKCIDVMNGRWYDGRKLQAAFYDGKTDYTYKETEAERQDRERKWEQWLQSNPSMQENKDS